MRKLPIFSKQNGQTLLVILLIMAIVLTVGLSIISSSITDIKISQQTEEASRAFYVAESVLEESLLYPFQAESLVTGTIGGVNYEVEKIAEGGENFIFPSLIESGEPQIIWLVSHDANGVIDEAVNYSGTITIYWGKADTTEKPALAVSYVYKDGLEFKTSRYNYDPDPAARQNSFDSAEDKGPYTVAEQTFKYSSGIINLKKGNSQPYFLNLILLYNDSPQPLAVKAISSSDLPTQGYCFNSTATVQDSGITRRIKQCKLWESVPGIFYWGVFSGGGLEKPL